MSSPFSVKDYLNYTFSGLLWASLVVCLLILFNLVQASNLIEIIELNNFGLIIFPFLFFGCYIIGNILRFSEFLIVKVNLVLFGNPYYYALYNDKVEGKSKNKLGLLGKCCNKKNLSIDKKQSKIIEEHLEKYGLYNSKKKSQHILLETYVIHKFNNEKLNRLKDLKNMYESISTPLFILFSILCYLIIASNIDCLYKLIGTFFILLLIYKLIDRYRFLLSNYIKETYRSFFVISINE